MIYIREPICLLADFSFTDSDTDYRLPFHVYLILIYIAQTFMVVHCGNILIENCWNHFILPGENVSEEFGKFLLLYIMFYYHTSIIL